MSTSHTHAEPYPHALAAVAPWARVSALIYDRVPYLGEAAGMQAGRSGQAQLRGLDHD